VTDSTSSQTLKKLGEWVKTEALSSRFLDFYISLLTLQADVEESLVIAEPGISQKTVYRRLANGRSLLRFSHIASSLPKIQAAFEKAVKTFSEYADLFGDIPPSLLAKPKLERQTAKAWFNGKNLPATMSDQAIDTTLLDTLIQQTLRPFLIRYSQLLMKRVNQKIWRRGYCPICSGRPDIAYLEKDVGERWLMCSRCDAQWRFQRLECPFCGNQDSKLTPHFSDEREAYRLYVCDNCQTYIKAVDFRNAADDIYLPLERLLTLDMDQQGQERGYRPGSAIRETGNSA
jgi:formate dehydrogenase maturation protein FdhE